MRDPVTIHHPTAGTAAVDARSVSIWEQAGWSTTAPAQGTVTDPETPPTPPRRSRARNTPPVAPAAGDASTQ